jgi:hypothetical protein
MLKGNMRRIDQAPQRILNRPGNVDLNAQCAHLAGSRIGDKLVSERTYTHYGDVGFDNDITQPTATGQDTLPNTQLEGLREVEYMTARRHSDKPKPSMNEH